MHCIPSSNQSHPTILLLLSFFFPDVSVLRRANFLQFFQFWLAALNPRVLPVFPFILSTLRRLSGQKLNLKHWETSLGPPSCHASFPYPLDPPVETLAFPGPSWLVCSSHTQETLPIMHYLYCFTWESLTNSQKFNRKWELFCCWKAKAPDCKRRRDHALLIISSWTSTRFDSD